jgi:hypothetical protein
MKLAHACLPVFALVVLPAGAAPPSDAEARASQARHARIVSHWTGDRRAAATPRELVIDSRGLGYLRRPNGALQPYGHGVAALA